MIIKSIFKEYTDLIEPLSLDEAYLDVTRTKKGPASATLIAEEIRARIKEQTDLTASAGISYCKFLAKIASDENKPNGQFVITPEQAQDFIDVLPITKFFGIGKSTAEKMHKMGVFFGKDLKRYSLEDMNIRFGKSGQYYYNICRGIDHRKVNPSRERKSLGAERTFKNDLTLNELPEQLQRIATEVFKRKTKGMFKAKTLTL
jgi:DNA polymerase-4